MRHVHRCCAALVAGLVALPTGPGGSIPESAYRDLQWRMVGPLRGGWATTACGVPGQPNTFWFGAADGGVWKTIDAGRTWQPTFQHEASASIGALAVAPSDAQVLYAGTGQVTTRWDVTCGTGVYGSTDGGATWQPRGLADSEHIGRIWIDPRDPQTVLVAALGHLYGSNPERGVFRTTDGGEHWEKVLFVDDDTGAVDLAADPAVPDLVFAATWQARRFPWQAYFTPMVGPGSGIWRSHDGGRTWSRVGDGLPSGPLGRIGLAVAPGTEARVVYATVGAADGSGLYRSDDGGTTWRRANDDASLAGDYFSTVTVDPRDPDTLYVSGRSLRGSTDGGKTFEVVRGAPGGDDYHELWIDPTEPDHRITAADQGAVVTVDGGQSWSSWYNQPTGQLYRVATDDRFPYWIYSGQQDSGTVAVASRSDYGQLTFRDWHPVGGDERDYDIPFPGQPEIVFGSGLGGKLSRWDARTGQVRVVSPWPVSSYGERPTTVRYRTTWLTPLAISPHAPHAIYMAAQVLFRSLDQGETWDVITPDLTGAVPGKSDGGKDVSVDEATACGYGVIFSIGLSPITPDVIWLGTDNGRVHLSRDAGKTWHAVTPPQLSDWSKVAAIDASPTDPGTAYLAVDRHRLDDFEPYVYVTHDYGATWREASDGLPSDQYVNVVRQDPVRPGLLYAGTDRGVFVSFDDGGHWQSLQQNLPSTGVNDLKVHDDDLVIATEGRGLWVLDDVGPLRHLDEQALTAPVTLLPPARAFRLSPNQNRDTPLPLDEPRADNGPSGAVIDYVLANEPSGPAVLEVVDVFGDVVRTFRSDGAEERPPAQRYFDEDWQQEPASLPVEAGHSRFVWDLRGPRPPAIQYEYSIAAVPGADTPALPQGMFVLPGRYELRLTVDGVTVKQPLEVAVDPRVDVRMEELTEQKAFYGALAGDLARGTEAHRQIGEVQKRLGALVEALSGDGDTELVDAAKKLQTELQRLDGGDPTDDVHDDGIAATCGALSTLATDVESADAPPTQPQRELKKEYGARLDATIQRWQELRAAAVTAVDQQARKAGLPGVLDSMK